ncbi:Ech hydrogenase, EchE subunit [Pseudodesulfovibrio profundus]|uniref:Ech hydrogenase, EchE subunit n=1 Tax=Pseudodesulfovibrio profundus TaxID=57320 RepID=A0A2C8FCB0_9BACT|nr:nickel-dependent hydrogenase large subunit [Pseudodesulfovibrio profundus]MBC15712.1 NADH-quinone oxidoreductase subunit D [Desulfovibrio sp.]SOB59703.1 Ech hydrogenase, EchE subunit [Pseudodesulfovibrio profundus]|tara:strand:+ start:11130 stop:12209 length:1080 start_codon:yes stop_codon:yes gene_type:complete
MATTVIPFGPQHPVLPEPVHLTLKVEDEIVKEAIPALGYVHRGLEKLADIRDYHQMIQVCERVCGICSMIHAVCYSQAVEELMEIEVPKRAELLRVIWSELHRTHSHLLWLGLFADAFGFESLFMQFWKIRERVMDINEATTGSRVIVSVNVIGGVRADLSPDQIRWILSEIDIVEKEVRQLQDTIMNDYTVKARTCEVGVLTKDQAYELGAAGPTLRGSGVAQDMRMLGYGGYSEIDFEPIVETAGDCWARSTVRFRECIQSMDLVRQAISKLPEGDINVKVKGNPPEGEAYVRVEQPRGECMYYIKGNGTKHLDRLRIRTPTFANIPPLLAMMPNCELADVPVIVLSIDPCISCTER